MNSRERYLRTLEFGSVDYGFNHELGLWGQTFDRWWAEGMPRDVHVGDLIRGCSFFGLERIEYLGLNVLGMLPPYDEETLWEDERYIVKRYADGRVTKALKEGEAHGTRMSMDQGLSWPVVTRDDWLQVKRRFDPASPARYPQWWADEVRRLNGRDYPLALTHNGCFGLYSRLRSLMGTQAACLVFYDDPVLAEEILDSVTDYLIAVGGIAVAGVAVGNDVAVGGTTVAVTGKVVAVTRAACAGLAGVGLERHEASARANKMRTNAKTRDRG